MKEFSGKQAAKRLGLSDQTLYAYIRSGHIHARIIPRGLNGIAYRISEAEIERVKAILEANTTTYVTQKKIARAA